MKLIKTSRESVNARELEPAAHILHSGGIIAYPTETVYGLGAAMEFEKAVQRVFHLKQRDGSRAVSVMIPSIEMVEELCSEIPKVARQLIKDFWPGPLTLVLKASASVPGYIVSADGKIGLRMPDHPVSRTLVQLFGAPVTSTSANISGKPSPTRAQDVVEAFGDAVDLVIDAGPSRLQVPSTVVDASSNQPRILRTGSISGEQIEEVALGVYE